MYVHDIIVTRDDYDEMEHLKEFLVENFELKDLGIVKYFLGMEVARSRIGIVVSQRTNILDLLRDTGMMGSKLVETPMEPNVKLGLEGGKEVNVVPKIGRQANLFGTHPSRHYLCSMCSKSVYALTKGEAP